MSSTFWIELSHSNSKDKVTVFSTLFKTWLTSGSRPRPSNNHETNSTSCNENLTLWIKIHDSSSMDPMIKTVGLWYELFEEIKTLGPDKDWEQIETKPAKNVASDRFKPVAEFSYHRSHSSPKYAMSYSINKP